MYDEAFYANAAARLPDHVFYVLRRLPSGLPIDPEHHGASGAEVVGVHVSFTPGDRTIYNILIVRVGLKTASVTVTNMRLAFKVPFHDGAYVHPTYLMSGPQSGRVLPVTAEAVSAVVNRAIAACYDTDEYPEGDTAEQARAEAYRP